MVPLLYSIIDFDSSPKTYERYDRMSARELFQMCASRVSTSTSSVCVAPAARLRPGDVQRHHMAMSRTAASERAGA